MIIALDFQKCQQSMLTKRESLHTNLLFIIYSILFSVLNTGVLMILFVAKVLVLEDLVILMRQLVGHVLLIKQAPQSLIKFQSLVFVYMVAEVPDGCLVFILQCFTQQRLVHNVHALLLNRCVLPIVVTILYSTCQ
jgi:hypothetical protein